MRTFSNSAVATIPALAAAAALSTLCIGCQSNTRRRVADELLDTGRYHRVVTTDSTEAQRYFDQGLALCYGFQKEEAAASFRRATKEDSGSAMAWWGVALALGPDINFTDVEDYAAEEAREALGKAARAPRASELEKGLVLAQSLRFGVGAEGDRETLNRLYAGAMRAVHDRFPGDSDVTVLFAEALMNLRPWNLWTKTGDPQPDTEEILRLLEGVMARNPAHPGANHLYIHAVEASRDPGRAERAADRLGKLVPASAHLVHMPSHIYVRIGRYADAARANARALEVDAKYFARNGRGGQYEVYRAHDAHFLAYAYMLAGRQADALSAARDILGGPSSEDLESMAAMADGFYSVPLHVLLRFGKYEEALREPEPPAFLPGSVALWHYGRALAANALGRNEIAAEERELFVAARAAVPPEANFDLNAADAVLEVAARHLDGEIAYRAGRVDEGISELQRAVQAEDALNYAEPPGWMMPVRHSLGALLLEAGRVVEAEPVYRADLQRNQNNGWALHGLAETLRRQKKSESHTIETLFKKAWAGADVELYASCFCRKKPKS